MGGRTIGPSPKNLFHQMKLLSRTSRSSQIFPSVSQIVLIKHINCFTVLNSKSLGTKSNDEGGLVWFGLVYRV